MTRAVEGIDLGNSASSSQLALSLRRFGYLMALTLSTVWRKVMPFCEQSFIAESVFRDRSAIVLGDQLAVGID